jgi:hypothetical protein
MFAVRTLVLTTAAGVRTEVLTTFGSNWFHAAGDNNCAALTGTPSAFAFRLAQPGAIVNTGSLAVTAGNSLSLIGGTVLNTGTLAALSGKITVAAVPGESLVRISQPARLPALLTGSGAGHATAVQVSSDGSVILTGSGIRVEAGDAVIASSPTPAPYPQAQAQTLTLSAARNIAAAGNLTGGDITLYAGGDITAWQSCGKGNQSD